MASVCRYNCRCQSRTESRRRPSAIQESERSSSTQTIRGCGGAGLRECGGAARQLGLAESTVRGIDLRYLERWTAARRKPALRQMGVDEIYLGKKQKFLTVVCNLETSEPLRFGSERKKGTLDEFFEKELSA